VEIGKAIECGIRIWLAAVLRIRRDYHR